MGELGRKVIQGKEKRIGREKKGGGEEEEQREGERHLEEEGEGEEVNKNVGARSERKGNMTQRRRTMTRKSITLIDIT